MAEEKQEVKTSRFMLEFVCISIVSLWIISGFGSATIQAIFGKMIKNGVASRMVSYVINVPLVLLSVYATFRYLKSKYIIYEDYKVPIMIYLVALLGWNILIDIVTTIPQIQNIIAAMPLAGKTSHEVDISKVSPEVKAIMRGVSNLYMLIRIITYSLQAFLTMYLLDKYSREEIAEDCTYEEIETYYE